MDTDTFSDNILASIRMSIKEIIAKEIETAKEHLESELRMAAAQITINLAKHVDVRAMQDIIVVTFRNENK